MPAPANDNLANVIELVGRSGTVSGTTVSATEDTPFDPFGWWFSEPGNVASVWYKLNVSGWSDFNSSRLEMTVTYPGGTLHQGLIVFASTVWPPTASGDITVNGDPGLTSGGSFTLGPDAGIDPPPDDFFYIGLGNLTGSPGDQTSFTLDWTLMVPPAAVEGICVAFSDETLTESPTWTRLDDQATYPALAVQAWSIDRGRSSELDQTQTGTATVTIIDSGGILDPTNSGSPFDGQLVPMKQAAIGLQDPVTGEWSTLFRGFVNEWLYDMDTTEKHATVTLELEDAFGLLSALEMSPGQQGSTPPERFNDDQIYFAGEPTSFKHVDTRINDALDDANWPASLRDIFSGNVSVQEKVYERNDQMLAVAQDAVDAEFPGVSNCYMSKDGIFSFRGRFARFNPTHVGYGIGHYYAGDTTAVSGSTALAPITGLSYRTSNLDVINAAIALPYGVDEADVPSSLVTDGMSITTYGWRGISYPDLLTFRGHNDAGDPVDAVDETKKFATYYVDNYKDPKTRVSRISFRPRASSARNARALWGVMCNVELGDLVTLTTNHVGGGGFDAEDFYADGIHYQADVSGGTAFTNITLDLDVSPRSFFSSNPFGTVDDGG